MSSLKVALYGGPADGGFATLDSPDTQVLYVPYGEGATVDTATRFAHYIRFAGGEWRFVRTVDAGVVRRQCREQERKRKRG